MVVKETRYIAWVKRAWHRLLHSLLGPRRLPFRIKIVYNCDQTAAPRIKGSSRVDVSRWSKAEGLRVGSDQRMRTITFPIESVSDSKSPSNPSGIFSCGLMTSNPDTDAARLLDILHVTLLQDEAGYEAMDATTPVEQILFHWRSCLPSYRFPDDEHYVSPDKSFLMSHHSDAVSHESLQSRDLEREALRLALVAKLKAELASANLDREDPSSQPVTNIPDSIQCGSRTSSSITSTDSLSLLMGESDQVTSYDPPATQKEDRSHDTSSTITSYDSLSLSSGERSTSHPLVDDDIDEAGGMAPNFYVLPFHQSHCFCPWTLESA
jgi:hypothetical protein